MGVMEAIKKGFSVATRNLALVLVLFVFNLIWNLASIPFAQAGVTPAQPITAAAVVLSIIFILVSIFVQGGSLGVVKDYIKAGSAKLVSMLSYGFKYYLRLLGLGLLIVLIIVIAGLVAALLIFATAPLNNTIVTVITSIIAIIIGAIAIYFIILLIMAPYSIVCDENGIVDAMKKSVKTVKRALGRVILLLVLLILISLGIGFLLGILTGLASVAMPATAGQVVMGIVNSMFNSYLGVVMMASFMALYLALTQEKVSAQKVF